MTYAGLQPPGFPCLSFSSVDLELVSIPHSNKIFPIASSRLASHQLFILFCRLLPPLYKPIIYVPNDCDDHHLELVLFLDLG